MARIVHPQANHPLTAIRRQGVVGDISKAFSSPWTVGVYVGGTSDLTQCSYVADYQPVFNDLVYVLQNQGDNLIIGSVIHGVNGIVAVNERLATQNFNSSATASAITWDALVKAFGCNSSSSGVTVLATGRYLATCSLVWAGNAAGRRGMFLNVNGAASGFGDTLFPTNTGPARQTCTFQVDAFVNDVLTIAVFQDSGTSPLALTNAEFFVTWIAPNIV
jgi:hypothetical protein